jgi:hypothetical protein
MLQGDALREYTRGSLWVLPTVSVAAAVIIGGLLSLVDVAPDFPLGFQGTADDAHNGVLHASRGLTHRLRIVEIRRAAVRWIRRCGDPGGGVLSFTRRCRQLVTAAAVSVQ